MTPNITNADVAALTALSDMLARQIGRLETALDTTHDPAVQALIIYAQVSREEALQRIHGQLRHLGTLPEPIFEQEIPGLPRNGSPETDEDAVDELTHGEAELCIEFRKGVKDQTLMPHTRHFLRDLMDRVTATAERYGRMH